jgi:hypothetical protein
MGVPKREMQFSLGLRVWIDFARSEIKQEEKLGRLLLSFL